MSTTTFYYKNYACYTSVRIYLYRVLRKYKSRNKKEKPVEADLPKLYLSKSKYVVAALWCEKQEKISW